jgi:uncharacterized protein (TIGR02466 family)
MKEIKIPYKFYHWGPLLCKFKLLPEELNQLRRLCKKGKIYDHRKELAGVIEGEYVINKHAYERIISPYLEAYSTQIFPKFYGKELGKKLETHIVWVNYMKPGECNPPHLHTNCQFSSVLYTQVPPELKKQQENFVGNGGGPGSISFMMNGDTDYAVNMIHEAPEEGDFYMFPYNLYHFVASYSSAAKTKKERISIAANFDFVKT